MPHFGHAPGPFWRTSGSIGHVYSRSMSAGVAGRGRPLAEERVGIGAELLEAALAAEVVGVALVVEVADRIVGRDRHPADRVDDLGRRRDRLGVARVV